MTAEEIRKKSRENRKLRLHALYKRLRYGNKDFVRKSYLRATGRHADLDNPKRFTEKIQWIKLYHRDPLYALCSDKYAVRDFVASRGHAGILNGLIGAWNDPGEIDFDSLPERFVIKATHGCGWNIICRDREQARPHWKKCCKLMRRWLRQDYSLIGGENHYRGIPPRLIAEEYLENPDGSEISDYKIFCFSGEPKMIQVDYDRFTNHRRNYYDIGWNLMEMNVITQTNKLPPEPRPKTLDRMLSIARDLSAGFAHVRVDLYDIGGRIYFGELTFTDGNGHFRYKPDSADLMMGEWFELPPKAGGA